MRAMDEVDETVQTANRKAVSDRLRLAISETGMTLDAFTHAAKIPISSLKRWLSGTSDPAFSSIMVVAEVAGVSLDWLATGKGAMRDASAAASFNPNAAPTKTQAFDPEIVHTVAWFLTEERGGDPKLEADRFVILCDVLQNKSKDTDLKQAAEIVDLTLRRARL